MAFRPIPVKIHLKNVEVDRVVVRLGADDPSPAGVPHHHVGVRAGRDNALPEMIKDGINDSFKFEGDYHSSLWRHAWGTC